MLVPLLSFCCKCNNMLAGWQAGEKRRGMAGGPGDPVGLLQIYIRHGKLREAGNLALSYLTAWLDEVS